MQLQEEQNFSSNKGKLPLYISIKMQIYSNNINQNKEDLAYTHIPLSLLLLGIK